jgi:DivIVA domain-containing protein
VSEDGFHLTPLDIRKQEFRKALRGFEPIGVEEFRTRVADELERILRERAVLEERVVALTEQLRAFREREAARGLEGGRHARSPGDRARGSGRSTADRGRGAGGGG